MLSLILSIITLALIAWLVKNEWDYREKRKKELFDLHEQQKFLTGAIKALEFRISLPKTDSQVYLIPVGPNVSSTYSVSVPKEVTVVDENEEADRKIDEWTDNLVKRLFNDQGTADDSH